MVYSDHEIFSVAIYLCDRAYGGPEEGGRWFDTGDPASELDQFTRYFIDEDKACDYARRLNERLCRKLNIGRRELSSVLSEGQYFAEVHEGSPVAYPAARPHYE